MVLRLLTPQEVRETTLHNFEEFVLDSVNKQIPRDILLSPFQGSGKSYSLMKLTARLAKMGKSVLISVPTIDLADMFKKWLYEEGIGAFILASHRAIFTRQLVTHPCPSYEDIQEQINLGVSSADFKGELCETCPFFERCYYPRQYSEVLEDRYRVVIIQHSHLQCQEVIYKLLEKRFDCFFVDESFLDVCYSSIQIKPRELEILKTISNIQIENLYRWMNRETSAGGRLEPSYTVLKEIRKIFDKEELPWTIPDYLRYYNQARQINPISGIEVIYELPRAPIRVLADATPPKELIKRLTGIEDLTTFGENEVLDIRRVHPENANIQLLDLSCSKTSLSDGNKFELILAKVAELCELRFPDKKILFTTYKDEGKYNFTSRTIEFLDSHREEFPTVKDRLIINCLSKGTNKYKDLDVQILCCGVFFAGGDYEQLVYKYKTVANYYNHKYGRAQINNIFPYESEKMSGYDIHPENITRIEEDGINEYNIQNYLPNNSWYRLCYEHNLGETQQGCRIRPAGDRPVVNYILNSQDMPSMITTHNITLREFLQPYSDPFCKKYW